MNLKTILTLTVIVTLIILSAGCINNDTKNIEGNIVNISEVNIFTINMQQLTTNYINAIDIASDNRDNEFELAFEEWDIKTDELWQSTESNKDNLWTEYISTDMTYEIYSVKWDALDNKYNRKFNICDKEYERSIENSRQIYLNIKDELTKEYELSVSILINNLKNK